MQIGLGELGLTPAELYAHTLQEFVWKRKGAEVLRNSQWHHTRALAFAISKPNLKNKKLTVEKFWPLPDDKLVGIAALSSKEQKLQAYLELKKWYQDKGLVKKLPSKTA